MGDGGARLRGPRLRRVPPAQGQSRRTFPVSPKAYSSVCERPPLWPPFYFCKLCFVTPSRVWRFRSACRCAAFRRPSKNARVLQSSVLILSAISVWAPAISSDLRQKRFMAARILSADLVQRKIWIVVDRLDVGSDRPFQLFSGAVGVREQLNRIRVFLLEGGAMRETG